MRENDLDVDGNTDDVVAAPAVDSNDDVKNVEYDVDEVVDHEAAFNSAAATTFEAYNNKYCDNEDRVYGRYEDNDDGDDD